MLWERLDQLFPTVRFQLCLNFNGLIMLWVEGCGAAGAVFDKHLVQQTAGQSKLNRCSVWNTNTQNLETKEENTIF